MKYFFLLASTFLSSVLFSGGLQLFEVASPGLGTADVGQAAISQDASTSYFNPAGMSYLKRTELLLGAQLLTSDIKFKKDIDTPVIGNNGGNAGVTLPALGIYFVGNLTDRFSLGLSINSPNGSGLDYDPGWTGKYLVLKTSLLTLDINPTLSIKIANWLSVGGGIIYEYGHILDKVAISPIIFHEPFGSKDGNVKVTAHDHKFGYNLGIILSFCKTKLGLVYRSGFKHDFQGKAEIDPLNANFSIDTKLTLPPSFLGSIYQEITDNFAIMADLGWQEWDKLDSIVITSDKFGEFNIPRDWNNVWHYGIAMQYKFYKKFIWQLGFAFDDSPTNKFKRAPDMPIDQQFRYATGIIYKYSNDITLTTAFEYFNGSKAPIDIRSLKGHYKDFSVFFMNFTFSKKF